MSSVLRPSAARSGSGGIPFASYAQIVRMLVPPADRISFYDEHSQALWINDGVEEPDFHMHVKLTLARAQQPRHATTERTRPATAVEHADDPAFVFAIRDPSGTVIGALGIVCRDLPAGARFRNADAVERILAPLLEILGFAWTPSGETATLNAPREAGTRQAANAAAQLQSSMPVPALLRRTLSLATELIDCAFGAVVLADRPFTLSQRVSPDESDLAINAAIDNVREQVLRWAQVRSEALLVNRSPAGRTQQLPYKLLALPVRDATGRVAALIMLFRNGRARDFASVDVDELSQIAAKIPADALCAPVPQPPAPQPPVVTAPAKPQPAAQAPVKPSVTQADRPRQPAAKQPAEIQPAPAARVTAPTATAPAKQAPVLRPPAVVPSSISSSPVSTLTMDARVRAALREGTFDLYVQPISALRQGIEAPRFEVLLRMLEGDKLHTPATFFNAAESSRLLPEVDCWVIGALLKTLRKRAITVRTSSLEFSINIAGQSLATDQFGEFIVAQVCRSAIPAGLFVFEISERTALEHEDAMEVLSARLRDVGCRIALDNCRSGLGTLDPLNKWPVSRVKIDASLIRNIGVSSRSASQVRAVAQIAADRGIETVAEGVETQSIHDRLLDMGIDYAQGFHLGRPAPLQTLFQ